MLLLELNSETNLIQVDPTRQELKLNQIYLVRCDNKLRRASLLATSGKRVLLFQLIDSGIRVELTVDSSIYLLLPNYFRHPVYAVQCRLVFADTLERMLTREEKQKITRQVVQTQRIRVVETATTKKSNLNEPYMIELLDESGNVEFAFSQCMSRILAKGYFEHESQELVKGCQAVSASIDNKFVF